MKFDETIEKLTLEDNPNISNYKIIENLKVLRTRTDQKEKLELLWGWIQADYEALTFHEFEVLVKEIFNEI